MKQFTQKEKYKAKKIIQGYDYQPTVDMLEKAITESNAPVDLKDMLMVELEKVKKKPNIKSISFFAMKLKRIQKRYMKGVKKNGSKHSK